MSQAQEIQAGEQAIEKNRDKAADIKKTKIKPDGSGGESLLFLGPEAIIMLFVAVLVDGGEFLVEMIPVVGQIISIMIDLFAVVFFGFWMWFRSGTINVSGKTGKNLAKFTKWAKKLKWLRPLCFIIEMIPIASSILPLWILVVYLELKHNN